MVKIDDYKNISLIRGDILPLTISAQNKDGSDYKFKVGDVVRFKVFEKKNCDCVIIQKDVEVTEERERMTEVPLDLTSEDTKIGNIINAPVEYWYEVELNPDTACQTIIGYDEERGAKIFKLLPEGGDKK